MNSFAKRASWIADAMIVRGYEVRDIMGLNSARPHRLSPMAVPSR